MSQKEIDKITDKLVNGTCPIGLPEEPSTLHEWYPDGVLHAEVCVWCGAIKK